MSIKISTIESFFEEGHSFVELLPYFDYRQGDYLLTDGSMGKIWELGLIEVELKDTGLLEHISNSIEGLLTRLPNDEISCQFILISDSNVDDRLQKYIDFKDKDEEEVIRTCFTGKTEHIKSSKDGFFYHQQGVYCPKRIRVFFTIRYFPSWVHPSLHDKARLYFTNENPLRRLIFDEFENYHQRLSRINDIIQGVFNACGITHREIYEKELAQLLYALLNPKRSRSIPDIKFTESEYLRDQILYNTPKVSGEGFNFEGTLARIVSLKELPTETYPGMFTAETYRGARFSLLDLIRKFMLVINFYIPSPVEAIKRVKLQKAFAFMQRSTYLGDKSVESIEKKEELDSVIKETFSKGHKIIYPRIHFIVMENSEEEAEKAAENILNALNRLGCEGLKEEIIGASLFLTCLPLNFDHYYEKFIRRRKRMISNNLSDMLPVYGSFKGTRTPAQLYLNRRGEIVFLDFFDSNINPHGIIMGASGAGKSFFTNDFILQNYRLGSYFFVLDKGESYKKLCKLLGGQYIRFDLNNPITINPFYKQPDPEHLAFLMVVLSEMASGGDERDRLSREQEGLLQKAVINAYKAKQGYEETTLSDVISQLKSDAFNKDLGAGVNMGIRLALKLTPFAHKGQYAGFFDGKNKFNFGCRFTVFELANLSSHQDLQMVVLLNIMYFITNFISSGEMRPKRKFLLIDEAWSLLRLKNTAQFITNAFKTFRKYRCSAVAITQELLDLTSQESGIAILANSSNKILLRQEPSAVDSLKEGMSLSEAAISTLKSVEIVKGKFSGALVITDSSSGVIRLVPDPFLYWIANSETRENNYLEKKIEEHGGDLVKALNQCVKEYPYGLG